MKIKFFCVKAMMIGAVATGSLFGSEEYGAPVPFELAGRGRVDRKTAIL
jgi:hypothetical protein